jgi:RNA polymerase sigma-70 factor (ECF subfamily)
MHQLSTIRHDTDLLARLNDPLRRDEAFGPFYDAYGRYVYMYALRMTSCEHDAADITQETFIRIHAHLVRGNSIVDPLPFCLMIARQRVLNLHRDHKQTVELDDEHIIGDAHDDVFSADLRQHIEREVSRLPLLLRDAFVLRYYDGLSYDAIATMISESAGTVRMRVQRAKAILRRTLAHLANEVDT